jgi:hypothetical protein
VTTVIQLHETKAAKQRGVFAAINIAARGMGLSDQEALRAAKQAREAFKAGGKSAAKIVSEARAGLRQEAGGMLA